MSVGGTNTFGIVGKSKRWGVGDSWLETVAPSKSGVEIAEFRTKEVVKGPPLRVCEKNKNCMVNTRRTRAT